MKTTDYIWHNGKVVPWADAKVHVLTHTLHYGAGAFEGIRVYKTERGPAVFRLREHIDRLFYSCRAVSMEIPFSRDQVVEAVLETLKVNKLEQGYIRPLAYLGYGVMGLNPRNAPVELAIACWGWDRYLAQDLVDVKVSEFIRIHPKSTVADAKICGHYVNSIMAVLSLRGTKYHEALFLDVNGNVAEGPGENIFLVKAGVLHTPSLGPILAGITRDTVIQIASSVGLSVIERSIPKDELFKADEAFFTGTAAEVTPIRSIDDRLYNDGMIGPVAEKIRQTYLDIVYGRKVEFENFLTYVSR